MNDTWKCHICGKERPDSCISVHVKPLFVNGAPIGQQNIRYCNDDPSCTEKVKDFDFLKEEKDE